MDIPEKAYDVIVPTSSKDHKMLFHRESLFRPTRNLRLIGENPNDVSYILSESIWRPAGCRYNVKMPDLIAVRRDNTALVAELKHSERYLDEALSQILNGERFALENLGVFTCDLKIVIYSYSGKYSYETIERLSP